MTNIKLDSQVMSNLKSENLIAMLNAVIDSELDKDTSQVNTSLVEECIDAILQIEQDEDSSFRVLIPLMKSDDFLKKILPKESITPWKRLNVFARVAVVAAFVATGTFGANAAVRSITDYDFIEDLSTRISSFFDKIEAQEDALPEDDFKPEATADTKDEEQQSTQPSNIEETTVVSNNGNTSTNQTTTTEIAAGDRGTSTTKRNTATNEKPVVEKTTFPSEYIETTVPSGKTEVTGKQLKALYINSSEMKTAYIFGEELSFEGLVLQKIFDDGSTEALSYKDCTRTSNFDTSKAGDYTVKLVYQNAVAQISVTVRPTEDTRFSDICSNDEYDYFLTSKGAIVTKYKGNSKSITLNEIDGNSVYSVEHDVFKNSNLISFSSNSCQKIMDGAFDGAKDLKNISIPKCSYIGEKAFRGTNVESVVIPNGVTEIKDYTFDSCENLVDVEFKGNVSTIGKCAFNECICLESIKGTKSISRVGELAFYDDKILELDTTLDNLTYAGDYAFAYCNMIDIDTVENMTHIGVGAFMYCYNISTVHIGSSIKTVPAEAFRGCRITSLSIAEGVESVGDYAFMSTQITSLQLPDSLKTIGTYAFYTNKLTTVKGGENVEAIGSLAFYPSKKLTMYVLAPSEMYNYAKENKIDTVVHNKNGGSVLPEDEL